MAKPISMRAQEFTDTLDCLGVDSSKKAAKLLGWDDRDVRRYKAGTLEVHEDVAIFLTFLIDGNISGEEAIALLRNDRQARLDRALLGTMDEDEYSQALRRWTEFAPSWRMRAAEIMANEGYGAEDAFDLAYVRSLDLAHVRSLIDSGRVTKD
jgi:hypothetical protein